MSRLSANAVTLSILVEGFPVAQVESFGDNPITWNDREIAETFFTPDNVFKHIVKNAPYIATIQLTADSILGRLLMRACGEEVGRDGFSFQDAPKIQLTQTNLVDKIPHVYLNGICTQVPAGVSLDNTKAQDYTFIIAFAKKKL